MQKRYVVHSKKRFTAFLAVLALLFAALVWLLSWRLGYHGTVDYQVTTGESLWSIAQTHAPQYVDLHSYINYVRDINGLTGDTIYAGQTLTLPVASASQR